MEYKGYTATTWYSEEDGLYIGKVDGIKDSLNFHGRSMKELEAMFHNAIDNYLDFMQANKKE